MPRAGFHNDNEYRAYPFVFKSAYTGPTALPTAGIVDCGFIMGLDSEYLPNTHSVYLHSIARTSAAFEFVFKTNAPGAANFPLKFTYEFNAEEWQTNFAGADPADYVCADEPSWEGFMTIGRVEDLTDLLPAIGQVEFYAAELASDRTPDYTVEPGRIQSLVRAYVRSINVGNYEKPRVPSCAELAENSDDDENAEKQIVINAQCLKNNIKLKAGYNCAIQQNTTTNSLNVTAFRRDGGTTDSNAEICQYGSELPLFAGQIPAPGNVFLNGGPACDDLITSISGVVGPNLSISADPGIQIVPTGANSIKIDVTPNIIQQNCG
jgi:hypothetical protein